MAKLGSSPVKHQHLFQRPKGSLGGFWTKKEKEKDRVGTNQEVGKQNSQRSWRIWGARGNGGTVQVIRQEPQNEPVARQRSILGPTS